MNRITSQKINLLTDKLEQLELQLLHSCFELTVQNCRDLIDERRQLLADIVEEQQITHTSIDLPNGNSGIDQFLDSWSTESLKKNCATVDFQNTDFCNSFLINRSQKYGIFQRIS